MDSTFRRRRGADGQNSIYDVSSKLLRQRGMDFGRQRRVRDVDECGTIQRDLALERIQELITTRYQLRALLECSRRTARASFFAKSKPSAMTVGWTPSVI